MKANLHKTLKSVLLAGLLALAVVLFPLKSEALTVQEVPNPRQVYGGWVTDTAEILTDSTEAQLNEMIEQLETKNGTELAVVTVPETAPAASPKEFTTELFNYWGIGKKGQDNGVLFLISVGDRRVEIETGYGVEAILPDAKVGQIIQRKIVPRFKQGDFEGGILAGTQALIGNIDAYYKLYPSPNSDRPWFSYIPVYIWFIGTLGLALSLLSYIWLLLMANRPLRLEVSAIAERSEGDAVTASQRLQAQQYRQNKPLVERYRWIFELSLSLVVVAVVYLIFWVFYAIVFIGSPTPIIWLIVALLIGVFLISSALVQSRRYSAVKRRSLLRLRQTLKIWGFSGILLSLSAILFIDTSSSASLLMIALAIGALSFFSLKLSFLNLNLITSGQSFWRRRIWKDRLFGGIEIPCNQCGKKMKKLTENELKAYLERPQQVAQELGSVEFIAWKCPKCQPSLTFPGIHLRSYFTKQSTFENCPTCKELTVVHTEKILQTETWDREGKKLIQQQCHCCNYSTQYDRIIPVKPLPKNAILVPPTSGRTRRADMQLKSPVHCQQCHYPMEEAALKQFEANLSQLERVAQKIGSLKFKGWHCSHCGQLAKNCHICVYPSQESKYKECPNCQELTVLVTKKTVSAATYYSEGKLAIEEKCQCCNYQKETYQSTKYRTKIVKSEENRFDTAPS